MRTTMRWASLPVLELSSFGVQHSFSIWFTSELWCAVPRLKLKADLFPVKAVHVEITTSTKDRARYITIAL